MAELVGDRVKLLRRCREYAHAIRNVETNCRSPKISATLMLPSTFADMKPRANPDNTT